MSHDKHTVGSIIQKLKVYDAEQTVEFVLDQEEFTSFLCDILTSLPTKYKRAAQEMLRKTNNTRKRAKCPALALVITHNFSLPPSVQDHYQIWKENPYRFWQRFEISNANRSAEDIAIESYLVVRNSRLRQAQDIIFRRFHVSFLYQLASLFSHGQKVMSYKLHSILHQRLITAFTRCDKITDEVDVIKANLQIWVTAGSRYDKICKALDKGALFLIPQIPDDMWENPNSLKGVEFDEAIAHLKNEGIMELSNQLEADFVANQILNAALGPFKWDVVDSRTVTVNLSTEPRTGPVDPYAGPRIIKADPDIATQAIIAGPSVAAHPLDTKPISISSLLNPPAAAPESDSTSRDIDYYLEPRRSREKRQRIN
ncbi:hypothetical protein BELL_0021g00280 [Botrytis elliptica]|uniref:Uncharacterized protein n=1 Tax=Botrytis elliptica TaxID=278938 RepID=A0A4Z1K2W7_9HELO|nr:hypothetical protein EAE99_000366 [Botrytis elliptica]TGO79854.1 hypothetical protein BELL_0021g00280 [Botrytis elliptica]